MANVPALVLALQQPGLNLFDQHERREEIVTGGLEALSALLPLIEEHRPVVEGLLVETLRRISLVDAREKARDKLEHLLAPIHPPDSRRVCIRLLAEQFPEAAHVGQRLFDFAADTERETLEMRLYALKAALKLKPVATLGRRLLHLSHDPNPDIILEILAALPKYLGIAESSEVVHVLDRLAAPTSELAIRCRAIELLGLFGEVDALERVMLLPLKHEREYLSVQTMVRSLLEKPRSVMRLSPKNFEHLVRRLLEKMGYRDVEVTQKQSWDQGIDVIARFDEERLKGKQEMKMIGQCKRYQRGSLIGPDVIDKMVESMKTAGAGRGVIITTSDFQPAALESVRKHQQIELIHGADLQRLLDEHMERDFYRVLE